jgi:hypothetical protein
MYFLTNLEFTLEGIFFLHFQLMCRLSQSFNRGPLIDENIVFEPAKDVEAIPGMEDRQQVSPVNNSTIYKLTTRRRCMQASSRHLVLASPYFQRMLGGKWPEGRVLREDGTLVTEVSE